MNEASAPLPTIPAKRYFTIGEVSELCGVKPYVLRYWEQEFTQLRPMKRRGNRRYYQHHEVLMVRRIRGLLYDEGFTISGARNRLGDGVPSDLEGGEVEPALADADNTAEAANGSVAQFEPQALKLAALEATSSTELRVQPQLPDNPSRDQLRAELLSLRDLLLV